MLPLQGMRCDPLQDLHGDASLAALLSTANSIDDALVYTHTPRECRLTFLLKFEIAM